MVAPVSALLPYHHTHASITERLHHSEPVLVALFPPGMISTAARMACQSRIDPGHAVELVLMVRV